MRNKDKTRTLQERMRSLILMMFIPLSIMLGVTFALFFYTNERYNAVLHNVTTASEFSQDFKEEIDLKMYYFVVQSHFSEGLPIEQVKAAQELATGLLNTTTEKDSYKDIKGVLNLCRNLESKMLQIEETTDYVSRQEQLENNIYGLTSLIQTYVYHYLYHESVHLNEIQAQMTRRFAIVLVSILLAGACIYLMFVRWAFKLSNSVAVPLEELTNRVQEIGSGDLRVQTPIEANEYETRMLSVGFEKMVERLNVLIEQNRQEQIRLRSAELSLLQAQINPHFLYNTLDTIIWLVEMGKNDQAVEVVSSLSSFFRSMLSSGREIISLREEAQHVRSYLEIQQVRYKDILEYEIEIDPALDDCKVPKLTLQPLVENALYHGIKMKRGKGTIRVIGQGNDGNVLITVQDDGAGMTQERLSEIRSALRREQKAGFGLSTVHERLQLLYGNEYGLTIESRPEEGTTVTVRFPKKR